MASEGKVVTITKKGQATIPKKLREKYGLRKKVLVIDTDEGILLRAVPEPSQERGVLKKLFKGKSARKLIEEARKDEIARERRLRKYSK